MPSCLREHRLALRAVKGTSMFLYEDIFIKEIGIAVSATGDCNGCVTENIYGTENAVKIYEESL